MQESAVPIVVQDLRKKLLKDIFSAPTAAREWTEVFQMELMNEITIEALNKVAKDFAELGRCTVNLIVLFMEQV